MTAMVAEYNNTTATVWSLDGVAYNVVSTRVSEALTYLVQRLGYKWREILEVSTATGWVAKDSARKGANVTAIDIALEPAEAARSFSAHVDPPI